MIQSYRLRLVISVMTLVFATNVQAVVQTINFDTDTSGSAIVAPALFVETTPLSDLYSGWGVTFTPLERISVTMPIPRDGIEILQTNNVLQIAASGMGSILNDASNFGNAAKSGSNFLAFNGAAGSSHFWRVSFDNPIGYFAVDFSSGVSSSHQFLDFDAYDSNGDYIGSLNNRFLAQARTEYVSTGFKSDIGISYIDIGQGLNAGTNSTASFRTGNWSLNFDDLIYGDFADAPLGASELFRAQAFVPLPASLWLMLSAVMTVMTLQRRRESNLAALHA